jgi:hypothetical protein
MPLVATQMELSGKTRNLNDLAIPNEGREYQAASPMRTLLTLIGQFDTNF